MLGQPLVFYMLPHSTVIPHGMEPSLILEFTPSPALTSQNVSHANLLYVLSLPGAANEQIMGEIELI